VPNINNGTAHAGGAAGMSTGQVTTSARTNTAQPAAGATARGAVLTVQFPEPEGSNPLPRLPDARLDLNVADNNYKPLDAAGFSEQRPELIAEFDFEPAFNDDMLKFTTIDENDSPITELLSLQISARQLRAENIIRLLNELKVDKKTSSTIEELEKMLEQTDSDIERETKFLNEIVQKISAAKKAFTVKFNESWIKSDINTRDVSLSNLEPVKHTVIDLLRFSEDGYKSFTNTKILLQLIDDLRNILKSFSPQLIGANVGDPARTSITG
jgi:hypothetical protein